MKKGIILILIVLSLFACSKKASLTISNSSDIRLTVKCDGNSTSLNPDESTSEVYYLNSYLIYSDYQKISVEYLEHPYLTPQIFTVKLKPGDSKSFRINLDRSILHFSNFSYSTIADLHYKRFNETDWSDDMLDDIIFHESWLEIPFPAGEYLVKLVTINGEEIICVMNFVVGEITYYNYGI